MTSASARRWCSTSACATTTSRCRTSATDRLFNRDDPVGTGPDPSGRTGIYNADYNNFSPRVGFAYTIDDRTVVRGGVGVFVNPHPLFGGPIDLVLNGIDQQFRVTLSRAEAQARGISYPMSNEQAAPLVQGAAALWGNRSVGVDFPNPYGTQWTATVERSFGSLYSVEASYVGNRGENMNTVSIINRADRLTGVRPFAGFAGVRVVRGEQLQQVSRAAAAGAPPLLEPHRLWRGLHAGPREHLRQRRPAARRESAGDGRSGGGVRSGELRYPQSRGGELPMQTTAVGSGAIVRGLSGGWQISGIFTGLSGAAYNVRDTANSYSQQRPDRVDGRRWCSTTGATRCST